MTDKSFFFFSNKEIIILNAISNCNFNIISLNIIFSHHTLILRLILESYCLIYFFNESFFCPRYPWSEGLYPLIYRDLPADDHSRRGTRHRQRRAPPEVAVAAAEAAEEEAAAASPPAPVPGCRRHALYRKPQCLPEAATSLEHLSTPATRRNRGDSPAGTHPPRLPGE